MKEFKVNEYITLKLEGGKTNIYVKGQLFNQCKFLLLNIPVDKISTFNEIESIDEAAEKLDRSLEGTVTRGFEIPPEVEFWGHCSNLQVWSEREYNTRLLHRNIAFPLLKKLSQMGDPAAMKVFKREIIERFSDKSVSVKTYLIEENYLKFLNIEDKKPLIFDLLENRDFKGKDFNIDEYFSFRIEETGIYLYLYDVPIEELDEVSLDFIDAIQQSEEKIELILVLLILVDKLDYLREDLFITLIDWMEETDIIRKNYSELLNIVDKLHDDFQFELYIKIYNVFKGTDMMREITGDLLNFLDTSSSNNNYKFYISIIKMIIEKEILLSNYALIDSKLKNLLKMLYSSKLGIREIKDAYFRLIDAIKGTKLIKDNFLELLNVFDSFDYETPRNILIDALQGGEKEFKGLITEALIRKNYLWIDTIILTPEFSDYITIDVVKNPAIDFFETILETTQFIKQKDSYNMKEYGSILKDFLESMKEKETLSKKEFKKLLKTSSLPNLK